MTAQAIAPFASAGAPVTLSSTGGVLRVVVALIVVLGAVFAAAWMSRRLRGFGPARGQHLEVLAQLPLGPRERAVLIRVGAQRLLLGVAQSSVRTLHVIAETAGDQERAAAESATAPVHPSFRDLLLKSLGK